MKLERLGRGVLLGFSALFALAFLYVACARMTYPFDLEWMEGGMLLHSYEVLHGRGIFRPPASDFIAYSYQPLYAYLVAYLAKVFGLSAGLGRAISIVSTFAGAFVLFRAVVDATKERFAGALAVGMFFAVYNVTGCWFDLVRVDSLFFALLLGGLYVAKREKSFPLGWLVSALLLVLAFKAKQLALFFFPLPVPLFWFRNRKHAVYFVLVSALVLGVDYALAQSTTHGWYSFFTQRVPTGQPYIWGRIEVDFWITIFMTLPVVMTIVLIALVARVREGLRALVTDTWLLATGIGAFSTMLAWARLGGADNNFLTVYVFAIIVAASMIPTFAKAPERARIGLGIAVVVQFLFLAYDPRAKVPSARELADGQALVATLAAEPGPVLVADHPTYALLAGKEPSYQSNGLWEWQYTAGGRGAFPEDLRTRIATGYYGLIVTAFDLEHVPDGWYPPEIGTRYAVSKELEYPNKTDFECKSGLLGTRPRFLLVRR